MIRALAHIAYRRKSLVIPGLLALLLLYQAVFLFFGLDFEDGFYHINRMVTDTPFVMAFLTYKIGHLWFLVAGKNVLGFRFFNWFLYAIMLLFPIFSVERARRAKFLLISCLVGVFTTLMNWNLLGYDTFSFFFLILSLTFYLRFEQRMKRSDLLLLALVAGMAMAARLPNLLVLPVVTVGLFSIRKIRPRDIALYNLVALLVFLVLAWISYGSLNTWFAELVAKDSAGEDHGIRQLWDNYLLHGTMLALYTISILFFWFAASYSNKRRFHWPLLMVLIAAGLFVYYKKIFASGFNTRASLFMAAVILAFLVRSALKSGNWRSIFHFGIIACFLFLPCAGSNSGLKYAGIFLVFLPYLYVKSNFDDKKILLFLLVGLLPFAVAEKFEIRFMDKPVRMLTAEFRETGIEGIRSTPEKVEKITSLKKKSENYRKQGFEVLFYGADAHICNYLFNDSTTTFATFAMRPSNEGEIDRIELLGRGRKSAVFVVSPEVSAEKLTLLENRLLARHYRRIVQNGYVIMLKEDAS